MSYYYGRPLVMNDRLEIVPVGARSREFEPASIRDLLLGDPLRDRGPSIMNRRTAS